MSLDRNLNLLIVDDDADVLKSFEIGLGESHYNLTLETDPVEALNLYKLNKYDIVITDVRMPKMSGINLLKKIKDYDNNAKVILITAYGDEKTIREIRENRATGYFNKPIDLEEMLKLLLTIEEDIKNKEKNLTQPDN